MESVRVEPLPEGELESVLPLVAGYQRFYGAEPDDDRNREAFRRFVAPSDRGLLLGARVAGELVGFACIHWAFSSIHARDMAYLSDVFVQPPQRGMGIGRALMEACVEWARARGSHHLEWLTALDNREAQRLYERMDAERSAWFGYEIPLE